MQSCSQKSTSYWRLITFNPESFSRCFGDTTNIYSPINELSPPTETYFLVKHFLPPALREFLFIIHGSFRTKLRGDIFLSEINFHKRSDVKHSLDTQPKKILHKMIYQHIKDQWIFRFRPVLALKHYMLSRMVSNVV